MKSFIGLFLLSISLFSIADSAQKIIALSPHAVEMLYAIGAGDRIVATVEYADFPEAAKSIPRIGSYAGIQIERVVELQPDLIVAWRGGNKLADLNKLESLGFKIVYTLPKKIPEIATDIIRLGELTGLELGAKKVADNILDQYRSIKARYADKKSVRVFYQFYHDPMQTVGPDSWIGRLIEDCHGENIFSNTDAQYPHVSLESVLVKDPQVIIIPHHSGDLSGKKDIWKNWQNISAVKAQRIYAIDSDILHRFSPRAVQGLDDLCQAINNGRSEQVVLNSE